MDQIRKSEHQYGCIARIGLIVPPANSTVEPEMAMLMPQVPEVAIYAARLNGTIGKDIDAGIKQRQAQYDAVLPDVAETLKGLELDVAWLGHTASTYVAKGDETKILGDMAKSGATYNVTAAAAIKEALDTLGCKNLGIVSAYPDWLTDIALEYWAASGRTIVDVRHIKGDPSIYGVKAEQVSEAVRGIPVEKVDAILVSGTGVPTVVPLNALADYPVPVMSSNLCFAWWVYRHFPDMQPPADMPCLKRLLHACNSDR